MTPLQQAQIAAIVRWALTIAGTYGVTLSDDLTNQLIAGAVALVPIVWSWIHKNAVDRKIKSMS